MSDGESEAENLVAKLREEISLAESGLGGAMMGIADSYMELAYAAGRGYGVHAQYRESNINMGKPLTKSAVELAAWAAEIGAKAADVDAKRAVLKQRASR